MMDKSIGKAFQIDRVIIIFVKDLLVDTQHATTQHFHQQTKKKKHLLHTTQYGIYRILYEGYWHQLVKYIFLIQPPGYNNKLIEIGNIDLGAFFLVGDIFTSYPKRCEIKLQTKNYFEHLIIQWNSHGNGNFPLLPFRSLCTPFMLWSNEKIPAFFNNVLFSWFLWYTIRCYWSKKNHFKRNLVISPITLN